MIILSNFIILSLLIYFGQSLLTKKFQKIRQTTRLGRAVPSDFGMLGAVIMIIFALILFLIFKNTAIYALIASILAALLSFCFCWLVFHRQTPARNILEKSLIAVLFMASLMVLSIAFLIVATLGVETWYFFQLVPIDNFLFNLKWSPQTEGGDFGFLPLFWGSFAIAFIAILFAAPIGLTVAIYLSEYANPKLSVIIKPCLELLAGIPSIVYGFFAAITIAPMVQNFGNFLGLPAQNESALAAGLIIGVMIIPFVSSLSQDALGAVPQNLREASYGLGATQAETIRHVVLPAAYIGIANSILLALSRAIGETMIVVMAAGLVANLTLNPFESLTTITVQIVALLTGDTEFDNPKALAAYALGLTLFLITMGINFINQAIIKKRNLRA